MTSSSTEPWMQPVFVPGLASVLIPAFNCASLIAQALDSVRLQTYRPIEILVVDDGSKDNTADVVEAWEREHREGGLTLTLIRQKNQGSGAARNVGLKVCKGEFIQLLDADDLLHPAKLAGSILAARETHADVVVGQVTRFFEIAQIEKELTEPPKERAYPTPPRASPYYARLRWDGHTPLYRREVFSKIGPFEPKQQHSTGDYAVRVKLSAVEILFSPCVYYYYRQGVPGALTRRSAPIIADERIQELDQIYVHLRTAGVVDAAEWRYLTVKALKTSYLAHAIVGQREGALKALAHARVFARRAGYPTSLWLLIPDSLLLAGMKFRYRLQRALGGGPDSNAAPA